MILESLSNCFHSRISESVPVSEPQFPHKATLLSRAIFYSGTMETALSKHLWTKLKCWGPGPHCSVCAKYQWK